MNDTSKSKERRTKQEILKYYTKPNPGKPMSITGGICTAMQAYADQEVVIAQQKALRVLDQKHTEIQSLKQQLKEKQGWSDEVERLTKENAELRAFLKPLEDSWNNSNSTDIPGPIPPPLY